MKEEDTEFIRHGVPKQKQENKRKITPTTHSSETEQEITQ